MRRRSFGAFEAPEELCRFVASEWPGHDLEETLKEWRAACFAWLDGDPARCLPFGEHGGKVDVLRRSADIKRGLA